MANAGPYTVDTRKAVKTLTDAGVPAKHADATVEAVGYLLGNLATKSDLESVKHGMETDMQGLRADMHDMKADLQKWFIATVLLMVVALAALTSAGLAVVEVFFR